MIEEKQRPIERFIPKETLTKEEKAKLKFKGDKHENKNEGY